jgi:hypothetical protein
MEKIIAITIVAVFLLGCDVNLNININTSEKETIQQNKEISYVAFFNGEKFNCIANGENLTTCHDASGKIYSAIALQYDL